MRLLIITQKIDVNDDILGFMHGWVTEFAKHFESTIIIALGVGEYNLPKNVKVLSLGKDSSVIHNSPASPKTSNQGGSFVILKKLKYAFNFFKYTWHERKNYDCVFIHMNQEYAILGGLLWRLLGKKVTLWRNHQASGFWVRIAVFFSNIVFCTSKFAFVAKYKKNRIMPVGIDTDFFKPMLAINKVPKSVLFLSRISPIKRLDLLIGALDLLKKDGVEFKAKIIGSAPIRDIAYLEENRQKVKDFGLGNLVEFKEGVPNWQTPEIYNQNEIFVNLTNSGSLDKTTMEAMACGQLVLVSNKVFEDIFSEEQKKLLMFKEENINDLAKKIKGLFGLSGEEKNKIAIQIREIIVSRHSLKFLADKLFKVLSE